MPRSMVQRRLSQAHRSRCHAATNTIVSSQFALLHFVFTVDVDLFVLLDREALFPGAILVAVAVVASPRTAVPPQVRGPIDVTMQIDSPGPRLWWGPRWRAIHGRGARVRKGTTLELFFEPESAGASVLTFMRHHSLWLENSTSAIELAGRRWSTLPRGSACAKKWS